MPIVVGAPRSGTTLLRLMLDAHPKLAIPPETGFLALAIGPTRENLTHRHGFLSTVSNFPANTPVWPDFGITAEEFRDELDRIDPFDIADGFRAFYRMYARKMNKPRWGDKTPFYVRHIDEISLLLPEARFIHIVRDGRDACLSWRKTWFRPADDISTLALRWQEIVLSGRRQGVRCPAYMEVRFEDLVADAKGALEAICRFIELEFHPAMLQYHEHAAERLKEHKERRHADGTVVVTREQRMRNQEMALQPPNPARVSAWRLAMSREDQVEFCRIAKDALRLFGYEP